MIITIIFFFLVIPMFFIAQPVWLLLQQKALRVKKSDCPAWNVTDGKLIHSLPKLLFFKSCFPPHMNRKQSTIIVCVLPFCLSQHFFSTFQILQIFSFAPSLFTLNLYIWKNERVKGALGRLLIMMVYPRDRIDHWLLPSLAAR